MCRYLWRINLAWITAQIQQLDKYFALCRFEIAEENSSEVGVPVFAAACRERNSLVTCQNLGMLSLGEPRKASALNTAITSAAALVVAKVMEEGAFCTSLAAAHSAVVLRPFDGAQGSACGFRRRWSCRWRARRLCPFAPLCAAVGRVPAAPQRAGARRPSIVAPARWIRSANRLRAPCKGGDRPSRPHPLSCVFQARARGQAPRTCGKTLSLPQGERQGAGPGLRLSCPQGERLKNNPAACGPRASRPSRRRWLRRRLRRRPWWCNRALSASAWRGAATWNPTPPSGRRWC